MMAEAESLLMKQMDAFIGVRGEDNLTEQYDVPTEKLDLQNLFYDDPVHHQIRVPHTKWVVLRYPTNAMAQAAKSSLEEFEDFYFNVCNLDYGKMSEAMDSLVELMNKTDKVRLVAEGTDLTFSIKDIPAIKCAGKCNIPDGEVYTAPVRNSINGVITYNTPSEMNGFTFENVKLTFKNGKIVDCDGNDKERLEKVFNTDEGARYVGEFAIGVNPYITKPMNNILFDEKIADEFIVIGLPKKHTGLCKEVNAFRTFGLDRIHSVQISETSFELPDDFDATKYYSDCFGIVSDDGTKVETIKLKVYGLQRYYLRSLPLHSSQQEIESTDDYSIFQYQVRPTFDFRQALLSKGSEVEVLEPIAFREEMKNEIQNMKNRYL